MPLIGPKLSGRNGNALSMLARLSSCRILSTIVVSATTAMLSAPLWKSRIWKVSTMGISRGEFFGRIGMLREVDPLTNAAYRFAEKLELEAPRKGHQHDAPWHVSFHGSQFPGDNPKACGRRAIYTMLDIPRG